MSLVARSQAQQLATLRRALAKADAPEDAIKIGAGVAGIETAMRKSGLYRIDELRPVRELFLDSRWVLGGLLSKIVPRQGARSTSSRAETKSKELEKLGLDKTRASEAERISKLPEPEKAKAYKDAAKHEILPTIELLIDVARPFWYQANRQDKHQRIADEAEAQATDFPLGPFALVYADPPWKFETYSEKGLERTPDQHYPTMTDDEIATFQVAGRWIPEILTDDAVVLMWCTSANLCRALGILAQWGFTYKTHAVWDKERTGTGLVFRNRHELLLYGTRGHMPGPQYQPPSVFRFLRGKHSVKPPEIRTEIEKMYPDFDERTRLELFFRGSAPPGWTVYGLEARTDQVAV